MEYVQLTISAENDLHEILIAELFDFGFDGFEEQDKQLVASIPADKFDFTKREEIEEILRKLGEAESVMKEEIIEEKNWNQAWEKSIKPQTIGKFFVHPTWTKQEGGIDTIELIIDPKMAFGTGYHPTTRVMLEWMPEVVEQGDTVLDAGTGTGILAIAALKLGAGSAFGFDVDEWSEMNASENLYLNGVSNFEVKRGSVEVIPDHEKYDLIFANINRNALAEMSGDLIQHLKPNGKLLLSGLLLEDEEAMLNLKSLSDLDHVETKTHGEWIAILFQG
ncbi:MAG: 50S ribosomal protein L11 methyltransferase [Balneolaceae bacterium]|nr:50S ribosomal protein L11 methyltransferase [Balneolaceae bacterium]